MKNTDNLLEDARSLITAAKLDENVDHIKSLVSTVKIGDSTNFGKVLEIGANSITFKAKDLPKTTIPFNARKMGSKDYVLDKLIKLKEETLEEAVPTPAVQKLIASIDMLSPKEYLLFLQALASNAQGVANMSRDVNGQSNAKAWKAVADHIKAAADAYAKRPVRMEDTEVQGESLEEGAADKNNEKLFDLGKKLGLNDSQIAKLIVGSLKAHNNPLKAKENLTFALDSTLSANSSKQKALLKFADAGDYESLYNAVFESTEV